MKRSPAPVEKPAVLTVAGSDSGGGAGIQADLKTIEGLGGFGTSVITSVTAQNTGGVEATHTLPPKEIQAQFDAVTSDFDIQAIKTGMLATASIIESVAERVNTADSPLVVDPVMVATSGDRLLDSNAKPAYQSLIEEATLVTPNTDETTALTGIEPTDIPSMHKAGKALVEMGADAALIKGGHIPGDEVIDLFVTEESKEKFSHPRIDTDAIHGTGCMLSSVIATRLGQGDSLPEAVEEGCSLLEQALRYHLDIGECAGTVHHLVSIRNRATRTETTAMVNKVVDTLVETDVSEIVPEAGMQIVGAPPYAESAHNLPAVEGRITRTIRGVQPTRGVRIGASSQMARFLIAAREYGPTIRFALNWLLDSPVKTALKEQNWEVVEIDWENKPTSNTENNTMQWKASRSVGRWIRLR